MEQRARARGASWKNDFFATRHSRCPAGCREKTMLHKTLPTMRRLTFPRRQTAIDARRVCYAAWNTRTRGKVARTRYIEERKARSSLSQKSGSRRYPIVHNTPRVFRPLAGGTLAGEASSTTPAGCCRRRRGVLV